MIFALLARHFRLAGPLGLVAGIAYGLVVMGVMSPVVLPIVGAGGMPEMVGFSFWIEHALFGVVLGLWPFLRPAESRRDDAPAGLATPSLPRFGGAVAGAGGGDRTAPTHVGARR